ncbi:MAG: hypothetical protein DRO05_06700 [Thermoproteota archaeon]|nr:MAG: hypothetical protein DRO05_06700 [Candidatus Korarchaeota archaeon]
MSSRSDREKRAKALKRLVEAIISREGPISVDKLVERIRLRHKAELDEIIEAVKSLEEEGKIELLPPPIEASSYAQYLTIGTENTWFYSVLGVILGTLLSIYFLPSSLPWVAIRWILGSIFVLYLPGFVTVEALFPERKELSGIERLALSLGLSLAIVPLVGLVLNYTPWGIRLTPIVVSLSIFTLIVGFVATYRKYKVATARS